MRWVVISLLVAMYLFEMTVSVLNQRHSRNPIPENVKDVYDQQRYQRWLAYSLERHRFSLVQQGFNLVILLIFLLGPFAHLAEWFAMFTPNPILQSLLFLGIYQTFMALLRIPFELYSTFSIEERHGFNRTAVKTFVRDLVVGYVVTLVLGGMILGGIQMLYLKFSESLWTFILVTWGILSVIMIVAVSFLGKVLLRLFNKFTPLPGGELRKRIEDLAFSLGFNVKAILVMDASKRSTKANAAFTGIGKTREVILFDTLLEKMSDDEILAVLAHELGHAVHKDTWRLLTQQIAMMALYAVGIGLVLQSPNLFAAFGFPAIHFGFSIILFSIFMEPISLFSRIPLNLLSRKAEYKADAFASKHTDARWMISALKVLSRENLVNLNPHPLSVLLYYSHPAMNERITALRHTT